MPLPSSITIPLALVASIAAVTASSLLSPTINQQRVDQQLIFTNTVNTALPPQYAIFQAGAGIFRGVAINVLWQRASQMKDEGKFFEAMQLADWITTLQPRFPQVWEFNSWNLAYNMSVATQTPEERWTWVRRGIDLLQQKGIPANPRSLRLYRQLAWIYFHKVGELMDDMHMTYKREIASEWHAILGVPPDGSPERASQWFKPIVDAPTSIDVLVSTSPELKPLVDQLESRGYKLDRTWVIAQGLRKGEIARNRFLKGSPPASMLKNDPVPEGASTQQLDQLLAYGRSAAIRDYYQMEPALMLSLMQSKGPLDWRSAASHALYWAYKGLLMTDDSLKARPDPNADQVNTDRIVGFALQQLMRRGRIVFDPVTNYFNYLPDPRFIPAYERTFEAVGKADRETTKDDLDTGRQNFLETALQLSYFYGDITYANLLYARLRLTYGIKAPDRYVVPIEQFVSGNFDEFKDSPDEGREFLSGMIQQAFLQGYLNDQPEIAERFLSNGKRYYEFYQKALMDGVAAEKKSEVPPFEDFVRDAAVSLLLLPPESLDPIGKSRLWNALPSTLRSRSWPLVRQTLLQQGDEFGLDNSVAFPAPVGAAPANAPSNAPPPPPFLRR